jgi:hypothetical protein
MGYSRPARLSLLAGFLGHESVALERLLRGMPRGRGSEKRVGVWVEDLSLTGRID